MARRVIDTAVVEITADFPGFEATIDRQVDRALADLERTATETTRDIDRTFERLGAEIADVFGEVVVTGKIDMGRLQSVVTQTALAMGRDFETATEISEAAFSELRRSAQADMAGITAATGLAAKRTESSFALGAIAGSAAFAGIAAAGVAGLGAIGVMGLTSAAQLEQVQISFNALLGSAEEGERVFRELQKFAALTPFEFPEVAAAAKRFLAFNEQVGLSDDMLQGFLVTVGDLASVTGAGAEGMNRIVLAIGQIASKGKVSLEELMQIGEAVPGFSAIGAIAQSMGVSTAQAMEMISAGTVDARTGINALLTGMQQFPGAAGAMEKQSQTLLGVFSTMKDTIGQAMADSFAPIIPDLKAAMTEITPIIGEALRVLSPAIGEVITTALPLISGLASAFAPVIASILTLLTSALEPLIPVLNTVFTTLGTALTPVFEELAPIVAELAKPIGDLVLAFVPLIPPILELTVALLPLISLIVRAVAAFTSWFAIEALVPIVNLLVQGLNLLITPIAELGKWLDSIDWNDVGNAIGGAFSDAWKAAGKFFDAAVVWFQELPGNIIAFIKSLPDKFVAIIRAMFDRAMMAIGVGIGLVINAIVTLPSRIINGIISLRERVAQFMTDVWNGARDRVVERITAIIAFVKSVPGLVIEGLRELITAVPELLRNAFERGRDIVSNIIDNIVSFVTGLPARLANFAMDVATGIVNFVKGFLNRAIMKINEGIAFIDEQLPMVDLPRLPLLANGAIITQPTIAGLGEAGAEVVIPLSRPERARELANQSGLTSMLTQDQPQPIINVNVLIGERQLDDIIDVRVTKLLNRLAQNVTFGTRVA